MAGQDQALAPMSGMHVGSTWLNTGQGTYYCTKYLLRNHVVVFSVGGPNPHHPIRRLLSVSLLVNRIKALTALMHNNNVYSVVAGSTWSPHTVYTNHTHNSPGRRVALRNTHKLYPRCDNSMDPKAEQRWVDISNFCARHFPMVFFRTHQQHQSTSSRSSFLCHVCGVPTSCPAP
jgi:hypothetical protein